MNVCKALLALLLTCTLASAAACKRDLQPTGEALYHPYSAIAFPPITILIRSAGHTIEIYFYNNGFDVTGADVYVDGQHTGTLDSRDAQEQISALCGPDFQLPPLLLKPTRSASMGRIASPSGHVNRDSVVADFNGDGKPDLAVKQGVFPTSSNRCPPGNVVILLRKGDGLPDVVAADLGLDMLLGNGDGTLGVVNTFASGGALTSIAVADFNLDGKPDVAAANAQAGGVSFYAGIGDGSFEAVRQLPLDGALSAVSGDFNGDGMPDLAVTNGKLDFQTPGNLAILLGNGDGTFQQAANVALPGPLFSPALAVGDLNGDEIADVVTALFGPPSSIAVFLGNGDGTFGDPILIKSNTSPPSIAMADLNGDGKLDLVLADCCGLSEASYLMGNGDGTFQPEIQFPSGPNPQAIALSDLNGDGRPDFVIAGQVADTNPRRGTLSIWYNSFPAPVAEAASLSRGERRRPGELAGVPAGVGR